MSRYRAVTGGRADLAAGGLVLAGVLGLAACGSSAPNASGKLLARIPGCAQITTAGGNSLFGSASQGKALCSLAGGTGEHLEIQTWAAGDTADQASYATGSAECVIAGGAPVPWAVVVDVSAYAPAYAASVVARIKSALGGTYQGPECAGTAPLTSRHRHRPPRRCRHEARAGRREVASIRLASGECHGGNYKPLACGDVVSEGRVARYVHAGDHG